jgi:hypothetical protein
MEDTNPRSAPEKTNIIAERERDELVSNRKAQFWTSKSSKEFFFFFFFLFYFTAKGSSKQGVVYPIHPQKKAQRKEQHDDKQP